MKKTILLFLTFLTYQFTFSQCHYVVDMQDSYGDGWNGAVYTIEINGVVISSGTLDGGHEGTAEFGINEAGCITQVYGCMDPNAINFSSQAIYSRDLELCPLLL